MKTLLKHFKIILEILIIVFFIYTIIGITKGAQKATISQFKELMSGKLYDSLKQNDANLRI